MRDADRLESLNWALAIIELARVNVRAEAQEAIDDVRAFLKMQRISTGCHLTVVTPTGIEPVFLP